MYIAYIVIFYIDIKNIFWAMKMAKTKANQEMTRARNAG